MTSPLVLRARTRLRAGHVTDGLRPVILTYRVERSTFGATGCGALEPPLRACLNRLIGDQDATHVFSVIACASR